MGPRASLDRCGISRPPTGIRSSDRPARCQSLYRLRYPAHLRHKDRSLFVNLRERIASVGGEQLRASIDLLTNIGESSQRDVGGGLLLDVALAPTVLRPQNGVTSLTGIRLKTAYCCTLLCVPSDSFDNVSVEMAKTN